MSLKLLTNNIKIWDSFVEELENRIDSLHRDMERVTSTEEFFRLQGEVRGLRQLLKLREQLNHAN